MIQIYDAVIIGSGITGAAIAYELSKKGFKTVNVERLDQAMKTGAKTGRGHVVPLPEMALALLASMPQPSTPYS